MVNRFQGENYKHTHAFPSRAEDIHKAVRFCVQGGLNVRLHSANVSIKYDRKDKPYEIENVHRYQVP